MALTPLVVGSGAAELVNVAAGLWIQRSINTYEGNDTVTLISDYLEGYIGLDGEDDRLLVGSVTTPVAQFNKNTVDGGQGDDFIGIFADQVQKNIVDLDLGNDILYLGSAVNIPDTPGSKYSGNTFLGGEGTDAIIVSNSVLSFNNNLIDLGDNDNTIAGATLDGLTDALLAGTAFEDLISLDYSSPGEQGPAYEFAFVSATEVFQTTIKGGKGDDILFLQSVDGSPDTLDGLDEPIRESLINGNEGQDLIGVARDLAQKTSILGGQGNDRILLLSGVIQDSQVNGNLGSDTLIITSILANQATFRGGQGTDTINVNSATIFNSVVAGDLGNDYINFLAAVSGNNTLAGGGGNDEIDDFSYALSGVGNVLDGGDGNDVLRQAANIAPTLAGSPVLNGVFDFAATFIGGKGADTMTGDLNTQPFTPKQLIDLDPGAGTNFAVLGASSDTFQVSFGDTELYLGNGPSFPPSGVGRDIITDFDSNASKYLLPGIIPWNNPTINPFLAGPPFFGDYAAPDVPLSALRQRDVIDLTNTTIKIGGVALGLTGVNSKSLVTSGVSNFEQFIALGASCTVEGGAIIWEETKKTVPSAIPTRSQLFISNGNGVLDSGDLLIQLNQVGYFTGNGGLVVTGGNITDIVLA